MLADAIIYIVYASIFLIILALITWAVEWWDKHLGG